MSYNNLQEHPMKISEEYLKDINIFNYLKSGRTNTTGFRETHSQSVTNTRETGRFSQGSLEEQMPIKTSVKVMPKLDHSNIDLKIPKSKYVSKIDRRKMVEKMYKFQAYQ